MSEVPLYGKPCFLRARYPCTVSSVFQGGAADPHPAADLEAALKVLQKEADKKRRQSAQVPEFSHTFSVSVSLSISVSVSLSHTNTHTHTHTVSIHHFFPYTRTHAHTHTLSLSHTHTHTHTHIHTHHIRTTLYHEPSIVSYSFASRIKSALPD